MKKLLSALLISLLVFSCLSLALAAKVKCPTCHGTGEIECPECGGTGFIGDPETLECSHCNGTGLAKPNIFMSTMTASTGASTTDITAVYTNKENSEVTATITASLEGHSITSEEITFPPDEQVTVELSIPFISYYSVTVLLTHIQLTVNADEITCSYCDGTGIVEEGTVCSECDGAGTITCPDCGGSGYVTEGAVVTTKGQSDGIDWGLITGVAGAGVVIAFSAVGGLVLFKRRRVSEASLRRLSNSDFQQWVLKRLDGKPGSSKDTAMGIDGFSRLNLPISIKQTDSVGMNAIDLFAASLARNRATGGIMVAFGFADDAIRGKVRARTNYRLNIEMMTVRELIEGRASSF